MATHTPGGIEHQRPYDGVFRVEVEGVVEVLFDHAEDSIAPSLEGVSIDKNIAYVLPYAVKGARPRLRAAGRTTPLTA